MFRHLKIWREPRAPRSALRDVMTPHPPPLSDLTGSGALSLVPRDIEDSPPPGSRIRDVCPEASLATCWLCSALSTISRSKVCSGGVNLAPTPCAAPRRAAISIHLRECQPTLYDRQPICYQHRSPSKINLLISDLVYRSLTFLSASPISQWQAGRADADSRTERHRCLPDCVSDASTLAFIGLVPITL